MTKPKLEPVRLHLGIIGDEVCRWYDKGLLSQSKCCELLEITRSEFLKQIHERGISAIQTTPEELQTEVDEVLPTNPHELSGNTGELKQPSMISIDSLEYKNQQLEAQKIKAEGLIPCQPKENEFGQVATAKAVGKSTPDSRDVRGERPIDSTPESLPSSGNISNQPKETPSDEEAPTRWAYDQACKALWKHRDECEKLESQLEDYRKAMEWLAKSDLELGKGDDGAYYLSHWNGRTEQREFLEDAKSPLEAIRNAMAKEARNE